MRISADPASEDYSPQAHGAAVYLDGVKRDDVITADEERGNVICYARDEAGNIIVNPETNEAEVVMLSGVVKVELPT